MSLGNKRRLEALRKRRAERETHDLNAMTELGKSLSKVTLTLLVKTGEDGKMFGSITSGTIADAFKTQLDLALDKKKIHLEKPLHTLGEHDIELRLHADVRCTLKIIVKSSNPLPVVAVVDDKKDGVQVREKRSARNHGGKPEGEAVAPAKAEKAERPAKGGKGPKSDKK
jgi:large subunit ribosomal protein L9